MGSASGLECRDDLRRHAVRREEWNGLDYLEVSDDQTRLTLYFLGPAPEGLTAANVRIEGGRRIRDVRVTDVRVCPQVDPEIDNCVVVTVDRPGDHSMYRLCLVDLPREMRFDPRYECLEFSFKAACPTDLDCKDEEVCPSDERPDPEISYLARDYASFRRLILDRLAVLVPEWTERHVPDVGITLVELLAYVGDLLSYQQDAVATEAYLDTARQRISVRRHARLVDYRMHEGCNARAWVHVHASTDVTIPAREISFLTRFPDVPEVEGRPLRWEDLGQVPPHVYEVFEPVVEGGSRWVGADGAEPTDGEDRNGAGGPVLDFRVAHNEIGLYTWGDAACCLARGATSATLVDGPAAGPAGDPQERSSDDAPPASRALRLQAGDVLILEEVLGPNTGASEDADPAHRHAVRLTGVEPVVDELYGQPLLEVTWAEEDALPFSLCLSAVGPPPDCRLLEGVSVARGNVVLVDHGRRLEEPEDLGRVPVVEEPERCVREDRPAHAARRPGRFRPTLLEGPLTFTEPLRPGAPATGRLEQDPRAAGPALLLASRPEVEATEGGHAALEGHHWRPRFDLLASGPDDPHVVVEIDDRRRAHLRFGDGELGRRPGAAHRFHASYRVGNGPAGNVGSETIRLAVTRQLVSGATLEPRNPLPARGGTPPEPAREVKLFAPHAFRRVLERAITADDYAELAGRHPKVQRAAAELRWNGSWYEARVAIDPYGEVEADPDLLREIERHLYPFRRIGHDLAIGPARYVPLDVVMEVCVEPGFLRAHVRAALRQRFGTRLLPDGSRGFFHPDALTFGQGIALSRLVAAAQRVPGVQSVTVGRLERLFEGPNGELEDGVLSIGALEIARLDADPSFPENGRIRFELRGGR